LVKKTLKYKKAGQIVYHQNIRQKTLAIDSDKILNDSNNIVFENHIRVVFWIVFNCKEQIYCFF